MTGETVTTVIVAIVGAAGVIYAAWRAGQASEHTPYDALADRVVSLEVADRENRKRIARLETRENLLVAYLRRLLDWVEAGAEPPPPEPPEEILHVLERKFK